MEQLFYNAVVHTFDRNVPRASAIALRDDRIVCVGDEAACRAALSRSVHSVNLRGKAVLPGFIDTHLHPVVAAIYAMHADLQSARSYPELVCVLQTHESTLGGDEWLLGMRYAENLQNDGVKLDRARLDAVTKRPLVIVQHDGHKVFANTAAMQAAGITANTPDPAGGTIGRGPGGEPDGAFFETASQLVLTALPFPNLERLSHAATQLFAQFAAQGVTGLGSIVQAGETGPAGKAGAAEPMALALLQSSIPQRLYVLGIADSVAQAATLAQIEGFSADPWSNRRFGGIKIFADGTFGSRTACLCAGYTDAPGTRGYMVIEDEALYALMESAHLGGLQIAVHAIGDEASRRCLILFKRLLQRYPRPHRHRIEHASLLSRDMVRDIAALGVIVSTQPSFIRSEKEFLPGRLGERVEMVYPLRWLFEAGAVTAGASDAPIESISVLQAVTLAACREGLAPEQCISVEQAFRMYTTHAAYAQREEKVTGSLEAGKRADLVILEEDPLAVPAERIEHIPVVQTLCGGETIYAAS